MLNFSPDQLYEVQRLHHESLVAEAGLHRIRRTTHPSPRRVMAGLRQLAFRWSQWLRNGAHRQTRPGAAQESQSVMQVYRSLLHTQQRR